MPLAFSHRTRRLLALALACWLVWIALLPALLGSAPADSAQTGGARVLLCTPQGMSWVQVEADSSDKTPFGSDEATSARLSCPLCALAQLLPPAAGGALALAWPPRTGAPSRHAAPRPGAPERRISPAFLLRRFPPNFPPPATAQDRGPNLAPNPARPRFFRFFARQTALSALSALSAFCVCTIFFEVFP